MPNQQATVKPITCSNAIRRMRVLATLQIILWHSLCPFVATAWHWFDAPCISSVAPTVFHYAFGDMMLPTFFIISGLLYGHKYVAGGV